MASFRFILVFGYIVGIAIAQSPPPSVIGQRNPNAIKSSKPEEPLIRNPGVPVASVSTIATGSGNVQPTVSSVSATKDAAAAPVAPPADYTPLGQTGGGITLEDAWTTLVQKAQPTKQPEPKPAPTPAATPISQPDPFDIFGGGPSNNLFDMGGMSPAGPPDRGGRGFDQGPGLDLGFGGFGGGGGLPLAALALAGGGLGEGLGSMGGMNMMRMLGGRGFGAGRFGGMPGGRRGGPGAGPSMDLARTMLIMQVLGGDAPDPPAGGRRKPGAPGPRQRSPLEELIRLERIQMMRNQQMERAMRNRNAPQNQGSRFEFQGRPRVGPGRRGGRPGPPHGRGRRGIRPTGPSPTSSQGPPRPTSASSDRPRGSSPRPRSDGLSPADASLRDSLMSMIGQALGQPGTNDLNPLPSNRESRRRPMGRSFGRTRRPSSRGDFGPPPSRGEMGSFLGEMGPPPSRGEMGPFLGEMGTPRSRGEMSTFSGEMGPPRSRGEMSSFSGGMGPPRSRGEMGPASGEFSPSSSGETGSPYPTGEFGSSFASGDMPPSSSSGEMGPRMGSSRMTNSQLQRSMRVGSMPRPSAMSGSANPADRQADRADMMADYMDNMQAMSPLQRLLGGGGMMGPGMSSGTGMGSGMGPGMLSGGLSSIAGLLGGNRGNLGLAALLG